MPADLKLQDFADLDLLYAIEEAGDSDGWATAEEIATQIGITHDRPAQCVGTRLGWMNRFGFMDKETEKGKTLWRLNEKGHELLHPQRLSAAITRALETLDEGQRAQITDAIARELPRSSRQAAHLARRTWTHHFGGWRDPKLARRNGR